MAEFGVKTIDSFQRWIEQGSVRGVEGQRLIDLLAARSQELARKPIVLLAEADAAQFLSGFMAATAAGCPLVLGNPNWTIAEWQQLDWLQPTVVWAEKRVSNLFSQPSETASENPFNQYGTPILIPTGGSSGDIRFAVHTWQTLTASVNGFRQYFECDRIHSCCVLPLYHVSGLMQVMRSFLTGGTLVISRSKLEPWLLELDLSDFFLSIVPTQLQSFLQSPETIQWLSQFQAVLLGGAPAWSELLHQARMHQIRLAPTYGMTETASQVVTLKPADFLNGRAGSGQVLPHAIVKIVDEAGLELPVDTVGAIAIEATSLMLDYCPSVNSNHKPFLTDDLGYFNAQGYLHIVGRSSQKIITGGENVFPAEVEAAIRSTGLVKDVCVVGVSDLHWGEAVTAVCVLVDPQISTAELEAALEGQVAKYKRPKHWLLVPELPRNAQGKINHAQLRRLVHPRIFTEIT